ncbi:MAG: FG-GAP repeat domain-containing protein [Candidatus Hodarchaeales archaeon]
MDSNGHLEAKNYISLSTKNIASFSTPELAYWIATGKLTGRMPHVALSCYNDMLYIHSGEGKKITELEWSNNFTSMCIGDVKGNKKNCLIAGDLEGVVRVIDNTGGLVWSFKLDETITSISSGDIDGDGADEILAGYGNNGFVLLNDNGELIWQKKIPTKIVKTVIGDADNDELDDIVVADSIGNIHIFDQSGQEKQVIHLSQRISGFDIVHFDELSCFVTYQRSSPSLNFWSHKGNLIDVYFLTNDSKIRFLATGQVSGDENDEIIVSQSDNTVTVMSIKVFAFDEEGNPVELSKTGIKDKETTNKLIKQVILSTTTRIPEIKLSLLDEIISITLGKKKLSYNLHELLLEMIKKGEIAGFIRDYVFIRA